MLQKKNKEKWKIFLKVLLITIRLKICVKRNKTSFLLNTREFYKGRRQILIAFEENMFPLPKSHVFGKNEWKEKDLGGERYMPKSLKLSFLQKYNKTSLSEKENKLFNRDFGYRNIDELVLAFNNTKTDEEIDELFDKIDKMLNTLKKLNNKMSDITEKKRINHVIKMLNLF